MTPDGIKEIERMLEAWRQTDNREGGAEKTSVGAERAAEVASAAECSTSVITSTD
jgi:hypothetical protein